MLSLDLPVEIEKQFKDVVKHSYNDNLVYAIASFLKLHDKYGWKEQLVEDVESIRAQVRKQGGIQLKEIDRAISGYRKSLKKRDG